MAGERLLDLRSYTAMCGDYSVHIMEELEGLQKGERLRVVARAEDAETLRVAARSLEEAGLARIVEEKTGDSTYQVVLEKTR